MSKGTVKCHRPIETKIGIASTSYTTLQTAKLQDQMIQLFIQFQMPVQRKAENMSKIPSLSRSQTSNFLFFFLFTRYKLFNSKQHGEKKKIWITPENSGSVKLELSCSNYDVHSFNSKTFRSKLT